MPPFRLPCSTLLPCGSRGYSRPRGQPPPQNFHSPPLIWRVRFKKSVRFVGRFIPRSRIFSGGFGFTVLYSQTATNIHVQCALRRDEHLGDHPIVRFGYIYYTDVTQIQNIDKSDEIYHLGCAIMSIYVVIKNHLGIFSKNLFCETIFQHTISAACKCSG